MRHLGALQHVLDSLTDQLLDTNAALELLYQAIGGSMRWLMEVIDMLHSRHQAKRVTERTVIGVCQRLLGVSMTPLGGMSGGKESASRGQVEAKRA